MRRNSLPVAAYYLAAATHRGRTRQQAFALGAFAGQLARAADRLRLLAGALLGGLLIVVAALHLAESAFPLHLLFQCLERLLDIVIAHDDLYYGLLSQVLQRVPISAGTPVTILSAPEAGKPAFGGKLANEARVLPELITHVHRGGEDSAASGGVSLPR